MGRVGAERRGVGGGRSRRDEKNKTVKTKNTMMDKNGIQKKKKQKRPVPISRLSLYCISDITLWCKWLIYDNCLCLPKLRPLIKLKTRYNLAIGCPRQKRNPSASANTETVNPSVLCVLSGKSAVTFWHFFCRFCLKNFILHRKILQTQEPRKACKSIGRQTCNPTMQQTL